MNLLSYKYGVNGDNLTKMEFIDSASFEEFEPETSVVVDL